MKSCMIDIYEAQRESRTTPRLSVGLISILYRMMPGQDYKRSDLNLINGYKVRSEDLVRLAELGLIVVSKAVGNRFEYRKAQWETSA